MVITLYADRHFHDIAELAGRLAHAMATLDARRQVAMLAATNHAGIAPDAFGRVSIFDSALAGDMGAYLQRLALQFAVTVVALGGAPNEQVLATLDASHRVLLVSDPSVAALRATQRALKLCTSLGYGSEKVAVLLHGFAENTPLVPAEAAAVLKREIFGVIPGPKGDPASRASSFVRLAERLTAAP